MLPLQCETQRTAWITSPIHLDKTADTWTT